MNNNIETYHNYNNKKSQKLIKQNYPKEKETLLENNWHKFNLINKKQRKEFKIHSDNRGKNFKNKK